jgi:hypothetical protein
MERLTDRFEADGSDGRVHTVLVYTRDDGPAPAVRLVTADGLTVVPYGPDRYYAVLTGAVLTRRAPQGG